MNERSRTDAPVVELTAVTLDCLDPGPMVAFYAGAFGAAVSHEDSDGAWIHVDGGPLILVRQVDGYRPPTWPGQDVPMQMHFELSVDDVDAAESRLRALGARTCAHQPHRVDGNVVMLDPAGHPFCIGARVS